MDGPVWPRARVGGGHGCGRAPARGKPGDDRKSRRYRPFRTRELRTAPGPAHREGSVGPGIVEPEPRQRSSGDGSVAGLVRSVSSELSLHAGSIEKIRSLCIELGDRLGCPPSCDDLEQLRTLAQSLRTTMGGKADNGRGLSRGSCRLLPGAVDPGGRVVEGEGEKGRPSCSRACGRACCVGQITR